VANSTSLEQEIVNAVQYYQSNQPNRWKGQTNKFDAWYELAYKYMMGQTWPKIKSNGELLVEYWPTYFLWGQHSAHKRAFYEDRHYLYKMGTFGTGYTCLTLSNLYIVSLGQATERFPLYEQRGMGGFFGGVLGRMAGEVDHREPLREDRAYTIPVQSVLDAQIIQDQEQSDVIALRTMNDQLLIHNHFSGQLEEILAAISMVHTGKLAQALGLQSKRQSQSTTTSSNQQSPVEKLKQLKQMLDSGLISNQEYETKKVDILSKM
jgi:hypothetical protein